MPLGSFRAVLPSLFSKCSTAWPRASTLNRSEAQDRPSWIPTQTRPLSSRPTDITCFRARSSETNVRIYVLARPGCLTEGTRVPGFQLRSCKVLCGRSREDTDLSVNRLSTNGHKDEVNVASRIPIWRYLIPPPTCDSDFAATFLEPLECRLPIMRIR